MLRRLSIFVLLVAFHAYVMLTIGWFQFAFDYLARIEAVLMMQFGYILTSNSWIPISISLLSIFGLLGLFIEAILTQKRLNPIAALVLSLVLIFGAQVLGNMLLHGTIVGLDFAYNTFLISSFICGPLLIASAYLTLRTLLPFPLPTRYQKPIRGTIVIRDQSRAIAEYKKLSARSRPLGAQIHPQVRIPVSQETRHFLYIGSHGSGKGQAIYQLLSNVRSRADPILIYDFKGDYTSAFGEDKDTLIVSPFDQRGVAWDVASDIDTVLRANEFANMLLPDEASREPFFRKAAQDLLTGVIQRLQHEAPGKWTFSDLIGILSSTEDIIQSCHKYRPAALIGLGSSKEKQAAGVFGELRTGTIQLEFLSRAWRHSSERFSISRWIESNFTHNQVSTVVLRGNPEFGTLDGILSSCFFTILAKKTLSLDDSYERRLWIFLDEFGNLPKIQSIDSLLTAVRSKGVRVVIGLQDIGQVETKYGNSFRQTFLNCFGTVLAGLCTSETAKYLSEAFGKHQIIHTVKNKSSSRGGSKGGSSQSRSESETISIESSLLDSEFSGLRAPDLNTPAKFWLKYPGWPIGQLSYIVKPLPKSYLPSKPAPWLSSHSDSHEKVDHVCTENQDPPVASRSKANASALSKLGSFSKQEEKKGH